MRPPRLLTGFLAVGLTLLAGSIQAQEKEKAVVPPAPAGAESWPPLPPHRPMEEIKLGKAADTPELRSKYPFLAEAFDAANEFNQQFPESVQTSVVMAVLEQKRAGTRFDLVFFQLTGVSHCGTLGCATAIFGVYPDNTQLPLFGGYAHPGTFFLARCPNALSLVFMQGHGMGIYWAEWRLDVATFKEVWSGEEPSEIPPCAPSAP